MSFERLPESCLCVPRRRAAVAAPGRRFLGSALAFLGSALAFLGSALGLMLVATPATAQSANHCASIYGPGFAPLAGSPACVRIGGRVRVDSALGASGGGAHGSWRVAPEAGSASRAAAPGLGAGLPHGDAGRVRLPRRF